jgi:hypothetical protein
LSLSNLIGGVDFNLKGLKASEGSASYEEEILTLAGNGEIPFVVAAESAILIRMSADDLGAVLPPDIVGGMVRLADLLLVQRLHYLLLVLVKRVIIYGSLVLIQTFPQVDKT